MVVKGTKAEDLELIDTISAQDLIKREMGIDITVPTVINWARKYSFGHQLGGKNGRWYIDKKKLLNYLQLFKEKYDGETETKDCKRF